ncbi:M20 metallopeptidase family protein [Gracilimonas mengyeensis]|uniref:Amidohydrolase n=1 Tax=Gracilimonas mengyeensis TaxID=1302730 RepID=A0A521ESH5_9BACT|nr:amidohydrolase [Gracilimonas mengyeensis]SMO86908.1 amidohydrolase [Gracilimonas mengyeensis]
MNYLTKITLPAIIRILCFSALLVSWQFGWAQVKEDASPLHKTIQQDTDELFEELVKIRRDLHQYPEIGGEEKRTSALIEEYLEGLGLEVHTNIGGYGVVGILNGDKPGKRIAWRADIDALPTHHTENVEFASKHEGVRHICGHDVHTAIALGMASVLSLQKEDLKGTVYFVFQPSEEDFKGAKAMISDGVFELITPDEMYAVHISPMPAGLVATKPGYLYADYKQLNITFKENAQSDSIIAFSKRIVYNLQTVAKDSKFWDTRNLMDPQIGIGNPNTIFQDYITVSDQFRVEENEGRLTIRAILSTSNQQLMKSIPQRITRQIKQSPYANLFLDLSFASNQLTYSPDRGNIDNDKQLAQQTIQTISEIYEAPSALPLYGAIPDGRGDDFAYFQQKVPGVYFLLGGSNFEKGIISMPHAPNFAVDEEAIRVGVSYFSSMIAERINN